MALKVTMARVLILICFLFSAKVFAQHKVSLSKGKSIVVPLMGYNSDMSNTPKWSNTEFSQALKELHTSTLRYPGGSNSLYWDWKTGWTLSYQELVPILQKQNFSFNSKYITDAKQLKEFTLQNRKSNSFWRQLYRYNKKTPKYNTISEFSRGLKATQSKGVFTLNVISSNLEKELGMLKAIEQNGIQLKFVELGNEVYAENLLTKHIYPTVDNYIDTCLKWSEAIWQEFPDVHIGVVGGDKNRRTREWNKKLSLALQNKFKDKESQLHFILHYYSHFKHPEYDFNTINGYRQLVAYPMLDLDFKLKNWRWNTTQPFTTWVTEFNMIEQKPYTINNTWAHGLLVSSQINQLLSKTKAEMFHFHSIGAESFPVFSALQLMTKDSTYLQPTTSGIVTAMWNKLTHNAEQLYQINVETKRWNLNYKAKSKENPNNLREEKNITFTPIHAYISYAKGKAKLLIVNLSEERISTDLSTIIGHCEMTQYYGKPADKKVKVNKQNLKGMVELEPYSISLLEE